MPLPPDDNFAIQVTDGARSHDEWIAVVCFGLPTLLADPPLLVEIIARRAIVEHAAGNNPGRVVADDVRRLFAELGLRIVPAETLNPEPRP